MSHDTTRAPQWPGYAEVHRVTTLLRRESVGGMLLVVAAIGAVVWANSPASEAYFALRDLRFGYAPWHLELSVGSWAADGLLAVFFFLVGLELKREIVVGSLRRLGTAIVPVTAAFAGVAVPALLYAAIVHAQPSLLAGWAIPTATDIAFAVAVLALVGSHLPGPLRIFLLTLAVVDDLIAIAIIAVFYTSDIALVPLAVFAVLVVVYGVIAHRGRAWFARTSWGAWVVLLPIGFAAWAFLHASGCTRRSPESRSPSRSRSPPRAVSPRCGAWTSPSSSSTASVPCRRALPCRCSPSSRRGSRSAAARDCSAL